MNNNLAGRKKRKKKSIGMKKNSIFNTAKEAAFITLGAIAAKQVVNNVGFLRNQPVIGGAALLLVGSQLKGKAGSMITGVAMGMATEGVEKVIVGVAPQVASTLSLSGGTFSNQILSHQNAGIAGRSMSA